MSTDKFIIVFRLLPFVAVLLLSGCDKANVKTESMLRLEKAINDQQVLVEKAHSVLDQQVGDTPLQQLANLQYAREIASDAADVFKQAKILNMEQPELHQLEKRLAEYQPLLAEHAKHLLLIVAGKTKLLREELTELKSKSYLASNHDLKDVVAYKASEYNSDIKQCCLDDLERINDLLKYAKEDDYQHIQRLMRSVTRDQEIMLKDSEFAEDYLSKLQAL